MSPRRLFPTYLCENPSLCPHHSSGCHSSLTSSQTKDSPHAIMGFLRNRDFSKYVFPRAVDALQHASKLGVPVILSDGDQVRYLRTLQLTQPHVGLPTAQDSILYKSSGGRRKARAGVSKEGALSRCDCICRFSDARQMK